MAQKTKIVKLNSLFSIDKQVEVKPEIAFTPEFYSMVEFMQNHNPQDFAAKYHHWVNTSPDDFILTNITSHDEKVTMVKLAATMKSEGLPLEQLSM